MRFIKLVLAATGAALTLTACAPNPEPARPVARAQVEATTRLALATQLDAAALRAAVSALLDIRRSALQTRILSETLARYITPTGEPDLEALRADLDAGRRTLLTAPIDDNAWTRDEAAQWLTAVARAHKEARPISLSSAAPDAHPLLCAQDEQARALLEALDNRADSTRRLARTAAASAIALDDFLNAQVGEDLEVRPAANQIWRIAVLDHLDDPEKRAAAKRALDEILTLAAHDDTGEQQ